MGADETVVIPDKAKSGTGELRFLLPVFTDREFYFYISGGE